MRWPWVSRSAMNAAIMTAAKAAAEADDLRALVSHHRDRADEAVDEARVLQETVKKAEASAAAAKVEVEKLDTINRNLLTAQPIKIFFQDGEKGKLSLHVEVNMDRDRFVRRPDKVMAAYGARAASMLGDALNAKLKELRDEEERRAAASEYRQA